MVTLHVLAQPSQRALVPTLCEASARTAESLVARMKETWRAALSGDEVSFIALVLDDEGLPLKSWEHPRGGFGDDGIETGRATLRAMKAEAAE